jgi:hypothetical protein
VKTGDTAGLFFSGEAYERPPGPLRDYLNFELGGAQPSFEITESSAGAARQQPAA